MLSRMDQEEEQEEAKLTLLIPPNTFLNVFEVGDPGTIEDEVVKAQQQHEKTMNDWGKRLSITKHEGPREAVWTDQ